MLGAFLIAGIAGAVVVWGYRDHRRMVAQRRRLLDACAELFENVQVTHSGDGFPTLTGERGGRAFQVRLFNDGMTIRRLPQLWLQVTELRPLDIGAGGFAVLVRPSGYEFFSLTADFHHFIDVPTGFPRECIVRGESPLSEHMLQRVGATVGGILADPVIKEVAATRKGLRLIRQVDEGRRGDYLLLRQAAFDRGPVAVSTLIGAIASLRALADGVEGCAADDAS
ncbi:hypothetical protein [Hyphomicrobium sulfonivorans]|uniref:hypothetical protein n=1 Tax=Hyphomicrobium sulfonivorans TaxID=121290 RepID=UPI00156E3CE0|nr:hypothetical protein [Hyphomicrobium sulfonivorans]MBI1649743.1 hypothetical protein [Hyphomicrobium sulfonivorans]NSL71657.1 hypothetical protein [Hyphomicrobium sulfonivorans]